MSIVSLAHELINEINSEVGKIDEIYKREKLVAATEQNLLIKLKAVKSQEEDNIKTLSEISKEKEYITKELEKIKEYESKEIKLDEREESLNDRDKKIEDTRQKQGMREFELKELSERLKEKEADIHQREVLANKQYVLDQERKTVMDQQHMDIVKERARLQRIATQYEP